VHIWILKPLLLFAKDPGDHQMALKGATFCISGTLSKGRKEVEGEIKKHGGDAAGSVNGKVTHLLCAPSEFEGKTSKVVAAQGKGIHIVKEDFLWDAIKCRKLPPVDTYVFGGASGAGGGGKAKAAAAPAEDEPKAKRAKVAKKVATVNPKSGYDEDGAVVYSEDGVVFDVEMIEKDDAKNMDKFYDMQVLQNESGEYVVFQHWGRTGTAGQCKSDCFIDEEDAKKVFGAKFKEKSGHTWGDGTCSPAKAGKYTVLQRMEVDDVAHTWKYHVDKPVDGKRPGWYPYDATAVTNMERYHSQFKANPDMGPRYVYSGTWNYEVDFTKMQQMNVDHPSHTTRQIGRFKA